MFSNAFARKTIHRLVMVIDLIAFIDTGDRSIKSYNTGQKKIHSCQVIKGYLSLLWCTSFVPQSTIQSKLR